ncbi:MAG: HEAT repeat domain-containing protein [Gammaproteobacteria bacterium]|nr:HEAT repeat domain-containing protein [Gammaproteobacteria bacterium]MCW8922144.1 HEAT repeat domain-containing protein [Gammaproteobacteria bacterium]
MNRLSVFLLVLYLLPFNNAQAETQCTVWGEFTSSAETKMTTMGETSTSKFALDAELIHRSLLVSDEFYWLGMQLHKAEIEVDGNRAGSLIYSVPVAAKVDNKTGEILDYHFAADLNRNDKQKLIAVFRSLHLRKRPVTVTSDLYILREKDDLGLYNVEYQELQDNRTRRVKLGYLKPEVENMASKMFKLDKVTIHDDEFIYTRDKCWHQQVDGQSDVEVGSSDGSVVIRSKSDLLMTLVDKPLPENALLLTLADDPHDWKLIPRDQIYPRAARVPLKSKKAFMEVFSDLDLAAMENEAILQLLYDNEIYLSGIKELLKTEHFSDKAQMRLFLLLGKNDSPQSQAILVDIFADDSHSVEQRFRSLMALKNCENPIQDEVVDKLFSYAKDSSLQGEDARLSHSALLVAGGIARNQKGSEFADQLNQRLASELYSAQSDAEVGLLLTALGNSTDENHQDTIGNYLSHQSPDVRAKAASALAKMPNQQTLSHLKSQLSDEDDSTAQSAILKSMGANTLNQQEIETVYSYATGSNDKQVRSAAIGALSNQAGDNAIVTEKLQNLKKTETSHNNLRMIMKALYNKQ